MIYWSTDLTFLKLCIFGSSITYLSDKANQTGMLCFSFWLAPRLIYLIYMERIPLFWLYFDRVDAISLQVIASDLVWLKVPIKLAQGIQSKSIVFSLTDG